MFGGKIYDVALPNCMLVSLYGTYVHTKIVNHVPHAIPFGTGAQLSIQIYIHHVPKAY